MIRSLVLIVLSCGLVYGSNPGEATTISQDDGDIVKIMDEMTFALEKLLVYLFHKVDRINLDTALGLRIAHGQLRLLLNESRPNAYVNRLEALVTQSDDIINHSIPLLIQKDPEYYRKLSPLIGRGTWEVDPPATKGGLCDASPMSWFWTGREKLTEDLTDQCLSELVGTRHNVGYFEPCRVTEKCWKKMTDPGCSGYSLTHQIIYLLIIRQNSECKAYAETLAESHKQGDVDEIVTSMCTRVFHEMNGISRRSFRGTYLQDLFMEQVAICGMLSYRELFRVDWAERIVSWQDPTTGCYASKKNGGSLFGRHRNKREEQVIEGDCLAHKSAVAACALAVYIRYANRMLMN